MAAQHVREAGARRSPTDSGNQVWLPAGTRVELVRIDHPEAHMDMAIGIAGPDISAMQLVWADDRGRWPWSADFDDGRQRQAVLGVRGPSSVASCAASSRGAERIAVVLRHVAQRRDHRHDLRHDAIAERDLLGRRRRRTARPTQVGASPGTASSMSSGPSMPQCSVAPARRTTVFVHCDLIPSRLNASNCSSPDGAWSTTRRSSAMPSSRVRYMVRPSPTISVGRSRGMSANQAGSVTDAAIT